MKILAISNIFPPHIRGGYELGALEIIKQLQAAGHTVVLATSDNDATTVKATYDMKNLAGLDTRRVFLSIREYEVAYDRTLRLYPQYAHDKFHRFAGYSEANCIALKHLIDTENPDVIYFFNPLGLGIVGLLELALSTEGKRVVMHMMDNFDFYIRLHGEMIGTVPAWERLKGRLNTIACSQLIAKINQERGSFAGCKVIYNSLDTSVWQGVEATSNKSISEDISKNNLRLVYWGQITAKKGILFLAEACAAFRKRNSEKILTLDIYGAAEKNELAALEKKITELNLKDVVRLKGFIDQKELRNRVCGAQNTTTGEITERVYDAGVFLLDASEPFAYAPIEAVLAGLYTVFPRGMSTGEVFGESPLAVKNRENAEEVAEVFEKILEACAGKESALPAERRRMIDAARQQLDLKNSFTPTLIKHLETLPKNPPGNPEAVMATARAARFPAQAPQITDINYPRDLGYLVSRLTKRLMFRPKLTGAILWVAEKFWGLRK